MDDAVERRAQELRDQRLRAELEEARAREARHSAIDEFERTLLALHSGQTQYPLEVLRVPRRDRASIAYFTVGPAGRTNEVILAEVEAYSYNSPDIPTRVFLRSPNGLQVNEGGTLPHETARRVADLAIDEMAKAVARGARVISRAAATAIEEEDRQKRAEEEAKRQREWEVELKKSKRWNWVGSLLGFLVTAAIARFLLFPWLRPLLESWFN